MLYEWARTRLCRRESITVRWFTNALAAHHAQQLYVYLSIQWIQWKCVASACNSNCQAESSNQQYWLTIATDEERKCVHFFFSYFDVCFRRRFVMLMCFNDFVNEIEWGESTLIKKKKLKIEYVTRFWPQISRPIHSFISSQAAIVICDMKKAEIEYIYYFTFCCLLFSMAKNESDE